MKQTDILSIILVAGIGVFGSFFLFQYLLGNPDAAYVDYPSVRTVISGNLVEPDPEIFASMAINPTVEVYVGECEDVDQNGILDELELEECSQAAEETEEDIIEVAEEMVEDEND